MVQKGMTSSAISLYMYVFIKILVQRVPLATYLLPHFYLDEYPHIPFTAAILESANGRSSHTRLRGIN